MILSFPTIKNFPSGRTSIYSNHYQNKLRDSVIIAAIFRNGDKPKIEEIEKSSTAIKRLFSVYVQLNINNSKNHNFCWCSPRECQWIELNRISTEINAILKGWKNEEGNEQVSESERVRERERESERGESDGEMWEKSNGEMWEKSNGEMREKQRWNEREKQRWKLCVNHTLWKRE